MSLPLASYASSSSSSSALASASVSASAHNNTSQHNGIIMQPNAYASASASASSLSSLSPSLLRRNNQANDMESRVFLNSSETTSVVAGKKSSNSNNINQSRVQFRRKLASEAPPNYVPVKIHGSLALNHKETVRSRSEMALRSTGGDSPPKSPMRTDSLDNLTAYYRPHTTATVESLTTLQASILSNRGSNNSHNSNHSNHHNNHHQHHNNGTMAPQLKSTNNKPNESMFTDLSSTITTRSFREENTATEDFPPLQPIMPPATVYRTEAPFIKRMKKLKKRPTSTIEELPTGLIFDYIAPQRSSSQALHPPALPASPKTSSSRKSNTIEQTKKKKEYTTEKTVPTLPIIKDDYLSLLDATLDHQHHQAQQSEGTPRSARKLPTSPVQLQKHVSLRESRTPKSSSMGSTEHLQQLQSPRSQLPHPSSSSSSISQQQDTVAVLNSILVNADPVHMSEKPPASSTKPPQLQIKIEIPTVHNMRRLTTSTSKKELQHNQQSQQQPHQPHQTPLQHLPQHSPSSSTKMTYSVSNLTPTNRKKLAALQQHQQQQQMSSLSPLQDKTFLIPKLRLKSDVISSDSALRGWGGAFGEPAGSEGTDDDIMAFVKGGEDS